MLPYLRVLSSFRDGVRQLAIAKQEDSLKEILKLCDRLRDEDLVLLGVALDDQEGILRRFYTRTHAKVYLQMVRPSSNSFLRRS